MTMALTVKKNNCRKRTFGNLHRYAKTAAALIGAFVFFAALLPSGTFAVNKPVEDKRVLLLHSNHPDYPWTQGITNGLVSVFEPYGPEVLVDIEYMYTKYHREPEYRESLFDLYKYKMAGARYDVLIVCDAIAFGFAMEHREALWPRVPIVFCGIEEDHYLDTENWQDVTGVVEQTFIEETLETALSLHQQTRRVLMVNGRVSRFLAPWQAYLANLAEKMKGRAELIDCSLAIYTPEQIVEQISLLGQDCLVLVVDFIEVHGAWSDDYLKEGAEMIRSRCSVPIYVITQGWFDTGIAVGGSIRSGQAHGIEAGKMAIRILQGEKPADIPVMRPGPMVYMFDYPQLKRFDIPLSALPQGSIVVNQPASFYYLYKRQIFAAGAVVASLVLIAAALATNVIRWKVIEKKLLRYQQRLKSLAQDLSVSEDMQRKKIATELTNCITEPLMISKLNIEALLRNDCPESFGKKLSEVCECLDQTIQDTRMLTFDMSSPILYETSFEAAVAEWLSEQIDRRYGIKCEFKNDGKVKPLSEEAAMVLFRMIRELLINVVKHSHASKVKVSLRNVDSCLQIGIRDNGIGFDSSKAFAMPTQKGGFGLFSIRERLERMSGRIEIESTLGKGTNVKITAPLSG